jgi:hypothetical protein
MKLLILLLGMTLNASAERYGTVVCPEGTFPRPMTEADCRKYKDPRIHTHCLSGTYCEKPKKARKRSKAAAKQTEQPSN